MSHRVLSLSALLLVPALQVSVLLSPLLSGCGEAVDPAAPPSKTAAPKAKAPAKATGAAEATGTAKAAEPEVDAGGAAALEAALDTYFYNPAGKRDPFQSFIATNQNPNKMDIPPDAPPLQKWDAEKFVLRGVIWGTDRARALLVDPEGIGHVVQLGDYVGRNWGKVTSITQQGVVITEEYTSPDQELIVNPVSLQFPVATNKP